MKTESNRLLTPLSQESLINLANEVKEIVVSGYNNSRSRILTTADLWNIQRQRKARMARRYF